MIFGLLPIRCNMDSDPLIISTTQALTQALNKINNLIEATDTQVAASLLGIGASLYSESFVTLQYKKYAITEKSVIDKVPQGKAS